MEFGRVASIDDIDLRLPPDHPDTAIVLGSKCLKGNPEGLRNSGDMNSGSTVSGIQRKGAMGGFHVSVGLPAWNDPEIVRRICPKGMSANRRLEFYARMFNAIELNSSGYALSAFNASAWTAKTPPGFLFYPKVPRTITHGGDLARSGGLFLEFCAAAAAFGDRLGTCIMQFSEDFGPSRFRELEAFMRAHAGRLPLAVEVRHRGWFANARASDAYFGLLAEFGLIAIIVDVPGRRDLLHQRLTVPQALVRFSGHDRSEPDLSRIGDWVCRLRSWKELGLEKVSFFLHHVPDRLSVDWASDFVSGMNGGLGLDLQVPRMVKALEPQLDLFGTP